ncbi:MAG TPA: tetratricopeptide repeat protein, partial [Candidatus Edwardsbacteria bacterium]|nr:tetratricopeptide repeat protein [Candidatus Edwardsbacteria bacterium]
MPNINALHAPFVFDDDTSIVQNDALRPPVSPARLWALQPARFVGNLTFALNRAAGGLRVEGYHAVNIAVHALASLAVFWLLLLIYRTPAFDDGTTSQRRIWLAGFGALAFATHPLQTAAVTYVVQRFASLAALFYILAVAAYLEARLATGPRRWAWLAACAISCALALGTKQNAFSLPLMLGMTELSFCDGGDRGWRRPAAALAALVVLAAALALLDLLPRETLAVSRPQYLFTQCRVLLTYLRLVVAPVGQRVDYDIPVYRSLLAPPVLAGCLALALLVTVALASYRRQRLLWFGIVWFLIALSIESSLIPISDMAFEHRLYLPLAGFAMALAWLAGRCLARVRARLVIVVAAALLACYGASTWARNEIWRSRLRIVNDTIVKAPRKARPLDYRGTLFEGLGWYYQAYGDYSGAAAVDSTYWKAYYHRGSLLARTGRYRDALPDLDRAIALAPDFAPAYINKGNAMLALGQADSAIFCYNEALSLDIDDGNAYGNRGLALFSKGEARQALADYGRALALDSTLHHVRLDRGLALNAMGRYDEALADLDA